MKRLLFVCLSVFTLSACGGTVCDRIKSADDKFYAGKTECSSTNGGVTVTIKRGTATCKTDGCSTSDQAAMDKYATCLSNATPCTAGNEEKATGDATACGIALAASNLSPACQSNFSN